MGTTIDNSIRYLTAMRKTYQVDTEIVSIAIETMCKYQKIEQIVKEWEFDHESMVDSMEKISEVVEDGNDN